MKYSKTKLQRNKKILQYVFVAAISLFLLIYFFAEYDNLKNYQLEFEYPMLILSFVFFCFSIFFMVLGWHLITKSYGIDLSFQDTWTNWIYSLLGKYLPGKVWVVASRGYMYNNKNIPLREVTFLFLLENLFSIMTAMMVFLISISSIGTSSLNKYVLIATILFIVGLLLIKSSFLVKILNFILKIMKREPINNFRLNNKSILSVSFIYILQWVFIIWGFVALASSFSSINAQQFYYLAAAISLSSSIGFLAFFAPAGLGVKEGIIVLVLKFAFPASLAIIISVVCRLIVTVAEVFMVLVTKLLITKKT